jgi:ATP/maltotriose-dependent transcriptional regulator MalT
LLGLYAEADSVLSSALQEAQQLGLRDEAAALALNLGWSLFHVGATERGRARLEDALSTFSRHGHTRMATVARIYLAILSNASADPIEAEEHARVAVEAAPVAAPPVRAFALAALAAALLAQGRVEDASQASTEAFAIAAERDGADEGAALVALVHTKVLDASGDRAQAHAVLSVARDRLLSRAAQIADDSARASFLANVPENDGTLQLARRWLDPQP